MEPAAIVHITKKSPKKGYCIGTLVSDDDSTMRANLPHYSDERGSKGKLPKHILEPSFLADPTHRNKAASLHFFKLANAPVCGSRVTTAIAQQMKKIGGKC